MAFNEPHYCKWCGEWKPLAHQCLFYESDLPGKNIQPKPWKPFAPPSPTISSGIFPTKPPVLDEKKLELVLKKDEEAPLSDEIRKKCDEICELLLEKNRKYGNSATKPVRVFSKAATDEQLRVRLDDKLSRIVSGQPDDEEEVLLDFIGYMILLLIQMEEKTDE